MPMNSGRWRRASRGVVLAALAAAAAACTILPAPRATLRNTFLLGPASGPSGTPPGQCRAGTATLLLTLPREEPGFDTARMAYLLRPNAVSYYSESRWADTPARMLAPMIARALEATGCWRAVVPAPSAIAADFRLDLGDLVLAQEFFSRPSRVRLALRAVLVDARDERVVAARRFEAVADAPSDDAPGGAAAAGRAAAEVSGSLAAWAGASLPAAGAGQGAPGGGR
ncbi:MAG: ABC-type transport auxiliary lipoprotein family protein [Gemmatimonadota bacterium]